jgi:hypothetical protein
LEQPEDPRTIAGLAVSGGLNRDQIVDAVKATKAGRAPPVKPSRHTTKLEDGTRVIVEGTAAGEPAIADALPLARKRILAMIRGASRGEAA